MLQDRMSPYGCVHARSDEWPAFTNLRVTPNGPTFEVIERQIPDEWLVSGALEISRSCVYV